MLDNILSSDLRLCYIDGRVAYFTSDFENQWGDDWDDSPYEHNSGTPYREKGRKILKLVYDCYNAMTPADLAYHGNSCFSVKDINMMATPWLMAETIDGYVRLWAKATPKEFVGFITQLGGDIFVDIKDVGGYKDVYKK